MTIANGQTSRMFKLPVRNVQTKTVVVKRIPTKVHARFSANKVVRCQNGNVGNNGFQIDTVAANCHTTIRNGVRDARMDIDS